MLVLASLTAEITLSPRIMSAYSFIVSWALAFMLCAALFILSYNKFRTGISFISIAIASKIPASKLLKPVLSMTASIGPTFCKTLLKILITLYIIVRNVSNIMSCIPITVCTNTSKNADINSNIKDAKPPRDAVTICIAAESNINNTFAIAPANPTMF